MGMDTGMERHDWGCKGMEGSIRVRKFIYKSTVEIWIRVWFGKAWNGVGDYGRVCEDLVTCINVHNFTVFEK